MLYSEIVMIQDVSLAVILIPMTKGFVPSFYTLSFSLLIKWKLYITMIF